jgi:hypothetical protein
MTPRDLEALRAGVPHWRYYAALLCLPLRPAGALTLLVLGLVLALLLKAGLLGIPGLIILLSWYFKYSFALLDELVAGHYEAPVLSIEMISASLGEFRFLLPLILVIAAFFATGAGRYFIGAAATAALAIVLLAVLPAVLAVQGWTGRLSHGLSPRSCWLMLRALGRDALWLMGCTLAIVAVSVVAPGLITPLPRAVRIALGLYGWLAILTVVGGAVHANQESVGERIALIVPRELGTEQRDLAAQRQRWLDLIYGAWRAQARDNAWQLVMERIAHSTDPLPELRWLHEHSSGWQAPQFATRVAQEMISLLLRQDREGEALRSAREQLARDPLFRPRGADESRRLAELAQRWGDRDTAGALLQSAG